MSPTVHSTLCARARARVCACVRRALASCRALALQFMYVHLWQTIIIIDHSFHAKVNNNSIIELLLLLLRLYVRTMHVRYVL